jgi:hypothetical protein
MKLASRTAAMLAAVVGMLLGATAASAATAPGAHATATGQAVAVSGVSRTGERFRGTYRVQHLVRAADGGLYAVAEIRGVLGRDRVVRRHVRLRVTPTAHTAQITPTPGACQVLNLTLGPLDLNLLGLRVRLSEVNLLIEAIPGGGLLGDLLCGLSGGPRAATAAATHRGRLALQRFTTRGDRLYAIVRVRGRAGHRVQRAIAMPKARTAQITPTPGACQVLNLTLGPLDLTLLGLRVRTNRIDLRVEAIPGGGLLGGLLCGLSGGPMAATAPTMLAQTLNQALGLASAAPRSRE